MAPADGPMGKLTPLKVDRSLIFLRDLYCGSAKPSNELTDLNLPRIVGQLVPFIQLVLWASWWISPRTTHWAGPMRSRACAPALKVDMTTFNVNWARPGGLSDAPHIPAGFRSFRWIPVPFQWNLPAKISLLPRNFMIPVISPEQSPECTGTEWYWNPVTGINNKNCQIWKVSHFQVKK